MKWIDLPPVWLAGFMLASSALARSLKGPGDLWQGSLAGTALIGGGLALMAVAALQMSRARTTIIPHRQAAALVTTGIFRLTRNPIYLGDAMVLAGWGLRQGAMATLLLVPVFAWIITVRFIRPEEARLRAGFGEKFTDWADRTPRWVGV